MSKEIREEFIEKLKQIIRENQSLLPLCPEAVDLVARNEDIIRFNEGTILKFNIPRWSLVVFEKHLPIIRKALEDSRIFPFPKIRRIEQHNGIWYISFDSDNLSMITYLRIDNLCEELENSMTAVFRRDSE